MAARDKAAPPIRFSCVVCKTTQPKRSRVNLKKKNLDERKKRVEGSTFKKQCISCGTHQQMTISRAKDK